MICTTTRVWTIRLFIQWIVVVSLVVYYPFKQWVWCLPPVLSDVFCPHLCVCRISLLWDLWSADYRFCEELSVQTSRLSSPMVFKVVKDGPNCSPGFHGFRAPWVQRATEGFSQRRHQTMVLHFGVIFSSRIIPKDIRCSMCIKQWKHNIHKTRKNREVLKYGCERNGFLKVVNCAIHCCMKLVLTVLCFCCL